MTEKPVYYDVRSDFWRRHWERALDYDAFLERADPEHARRWREAEERTPQLSEEQRQRLTGYSRELNLLMYAGAWCGDCARQGPMLRRIVEACGPEARLRVIDRDASEELQDELRLLGGRRVPVAVFLSEDWWEVGRFGDRTLSFYRSRAAREVGRGVDAGILSPGALSAQLEEWVDIVERILLMLRLAPALRKRHGD